MQEWIAVYDGVLGGKLRGLRKAIGCSEAEALGILCFLWFWARNNADETGSLENADREDIECALNNHISKSIDAGLAVTALIETGWIDYDGNEYLIHNWGKWQAFWFKAERRKEKDRERKRGTGSEGTPNTPKEIENETAPTTSAPERIEIELPDDVPAVCYEKKKKKQGNESGNDPSKIAFFDAEFVKMKQSEFDKLVEDYGEEFVKECIMALDNYKGSTGKTYKSDYRTILSWVVAKVTKEHPEIRQQKKSSICSDNPFEEYT